MPNGVYIYLTILQVKHDIKIGWRVTKQSLVKNNSFVLEFLHLFLYIFE